MVCWYHLVRFSLYLYNLLSIYARHDPTIMIINGRAIADQLYDELKKRVAKLRQKGVIPHLVVLLIGENPASVSYITQKKRHAELIDAKVTIMQFPEQVTTDELVKTIEKLNINKSVHAILVQKPLPEQIDVPTIDETISPNKDVDGFNSKSTFVLALPLAVMKILEYIYSTNSLIANEVKQSILTDEIAALSSVAHNDGKDQFISWLRSKTIVVLGKGPTAGGPTIVHMEKLGLQPNVIDSKTESSHEIMKQADILISAVGKEHAVTAHDLKKGVILIGVGLYRGADGKNHGDYDEEDIKDIAGFYTPTPRGVGPVNVACLMENVVTAAEQQTPFSS